MEFLPSREVAIQFGSFAVHWYGVMYLLAFSTVLFLVPRLQRFRSLQLSSDTITSLVTWAIVGVIIGGRLGYVLFYEFSYFLEHPLEILFVWQGGMSSHGGFLGVAIAVLIAMKKYKVPLLPFLDIVTVPIAIGLAFGRVGNFINLELYGTPTVLPWGIVIPGVEELRHPTQIYAVVKNLSIAFLCFALLTNRYVKPGITFGVFLILYAIFRSIVEIYRVPSHPQVDIFLGEITRGQLLSIPILLVGLTVVLRSR